MVVFPKAYRGYTRLYPQGFSVILSLICCLQVKAELARPLGPFGFKPIFQKMRMPGFCFIRKIVYSHGGLIVA